MHEQTLDSPAEMEQKLSSVSPSFAYRFRGALVAIPLVASVFCTWHESENAPFVWAAAIVVFAMGLAIRIWAQQYLHFRLAMKMVLTTGGPYSLVRNPIYIGNTLICLGVTIASKLLWMVPITLLMCLVVFKYVVRYEEAYLIDRYGDEYRAYQQQVPRWVPRFPHSAQKLWAPHYLGRSVKTELYNLLFLIPAILKEVLTRGH